MTKEQHIEEFISICVAIFDDLKATGRLAEALDETGPVSNDLSVENQR
jgi:hypothetical protein